MLKERATETANGINQKDETLMQTAINILKIHRDDYIVKINNIIDTITPKGDFLYSCDPNEIKRLKNLLSQFESIVSEIDQAIKKLQSV